MPKNPREYKVSDIVSRYTNHFSKGGASIEAEEEGRVQRQAKSADVSDSYYDFVSASYENGWSTHFHYCPFYPGDSIRESLTFYEHRLAILMSLQPYMRVLDVGCGIGGPAREIAKLVGCEVVGITINQQQVDRARELTAKAGLSHKCTFIRGDFMDLPFPPSTFDAAYAIEATVHARCLEQVYKSISRVLKPNGIFGASEWVLTPQYDASNSTHTRIRNDIEKGNGITNLQTDSVAREAMNSAGFELLYDEDFSQHWHRALRFDDDLDESHIGTPKNVKSDQKANNTGHLSSDDSNVIVSNNNNDKPTTETALHRDTCIDAAMINTSKTTTKKTTTSTTSSSPSSTASSPSSPSSNPPKSKSKSLPPKVLPWTYPLKGQIRHTTTPQDFWLVLKLHPFMRFIGYMIIYLLEKLHILPQGGIQAVETLGVCVDSVVRGGEEGVFTPCWWFVGRKIGDGIEGRDQEGLGDGGADEE